MVTGPSSRARELGPPSDRHVVRGPFLEAPPPLVVNLRRRHVPVAEQLLDLDDIHAGIKQQRRRGRPKRMRCVDAPFDLRDSAVLGRDLSFPQRRWEPRQVALNQVVHQDGDDGRASELLAPRVEPGTEERPLRQLRLGDVGRDRLRRGEVQPDPPVLVSFLVERDGRLVAVLVEVFDPEAARRANSGPAIEEELDDGPIPVVDTVSPEGSPMSCRARVAERAFVSSRGSDEPRAMN